MAAGSNQTTATNFRSTIAEQHYKSTRSDEADSQPTNQDLDIKEKDTYLQEVQGVQGQKVAFKCQTMNSSVSPVEVKWYRMKGGKAEVIDENGGEMITINLVTLDDEGLYKCTIYDGNSSTAERVTFFQLRISVPGRQVPVITSP